MKCPSYEILQDYFEGLTADSVSDKTHAHLEACDHCSTVLSEMAMVDQFFLTADAPAPEAALENKVFLAASSVLNERRRRAKEIKRRKAERQEFLDSLKDLKDYISHEGRAPALQLAGLSAIALYVTQAQEIEKRDINYSPIDMEVRSYNSEE